MAEGRNSKGQFVKGHKKLGNSNGRYKLQPEYAEIDRGNPERIARMLDDPDCPYEVKARLIMWIGEMIHGKPKIQADVDVSADVAATVKPLTLLEMRDLVLSLPPPRDDG